MGRTTPWATGGNFTGTILVHVETWPDPWLHYYTTECTFVDGIGGCGVPLTLRAFFGPEFVRVIAIADGVGTWEAFLGYLLCSEVPCSSGIAAEAGHPAP